MGRKILKKNSVRPVLRSASIFFLPVFLGLSMIYAETDSGLFWDSFGVFNSPEQSSPKTVNVGKEEEKPVLFFSAFTFKGPFEAKLLSGLVPTENQAWESIPGMNTLLPKPPQIVRGRREFFALYPSLGKEEIFVMALSVANQPKPGSGEAYVGATTERRAFDALTDVRSQSTSLPGVNQNISRGMDNQAGNLLFGYIAGHAGIHMGLGMRMAGNGVGLAVPESAKSSIGVSYSVFSGTTSQNQLDFFLQVSGVKRFNDKTLIPVEPPVSLKGWPQGYEYYVNPGFSVSTRNLRFEGLVRVPLHQPFPTTDGVLSSEIQGQLGVKYSFSESSPNLPK
ncbi:hypothetical protein LEP1GSC047_0470 [Leptospira inadai serovar Lyme str. 10]|uniref:Uncharacterized protein n=2 Tax=Leptospira inadai serovar Lyme TaxID=293084 RepID=V6HBG5_9LEPT|nr:hypothetical protein [Leptospira inadai]EQA35948.1 hypothetical protein LEP1GSC047_0470 [Leptospira inadai serovar Lyme str. 10]PNV76945.1 hypothetical protein BES34_001330 [Leptospira inadai serovar Lyme]